MSVTPAIAGSSPHVVTVEHWFDFTCPYCYIAQDRNRVLRDRGVHLAEHPLQIHPGIGPGGTPAGPRSGPSYDFLAQEAAAAGLPLNWSDRIPHSRPALAAFAWLSGAGSGVAGRFAEAVFGAYFADGRNIESGDLLASLAEEAGAETDGLPGALSSAAANDALRDSEARARAYGINGTPAWIGGGRQVSGLRPRQWFADWADALTPREPGEQ